MNHVMTCRFNWCQFTRVLVLIRANNCTLELSLGIAGSVIQCKDVRGTKVRERIARVRDCITGVRRALVAAGDVLQWPSNECHGMQRQQSLSADIRAEIYQSRQTVIAR